MKSRRLHPREKADVARNPAALIAKHRLDSNSAEPWGIRWDGYSGLPGRLWGKTKKVYSGSPEEIARQFLKEYRPLFTGLVSEEDPSHLEFRVFKVRTDALRQQTSVSLQLFYKGIEVSKRRRVIHVNPGGQVVGVAGRAVYITDLDVAAVLGPDEAVAALQSAAAPDSLLASSEPVLIVYSHTRPARLAYEFEAGVFDGHMFRPNVFHVDAKTGDVLDVLNLLPDLPPEYRTVEPKRNDPTRHPGIDPQALDSEEKRRAWPGKRLPVFSTPRENPHGETEDSTKAKPEPEGQPPPNEPDPDLLLRKEARHSRRGSAQDGEAANPKATAWIQSASYSSDRTGGRDL